MTEKTAADIEETANPADVHAGAAPRQDAASSAPEGIETLPAPAPDEEAVQIVSFFLDGDEYAFEVIDAVEVLRPKEITDVPQRPRFIKGLISVRGEMVPVIDLKMRMNDGKGASEYNLLSSRILIGGAYESKAGFLVDGIGGVKEVKAGSMEAAEDRGVGASGFLKGVIRLDDKVIRLLDIERILDTEGA